MGRLAIANSYGNVDLTSRKLSKRYVHVARPVHSACRKLRLPFAPAVVGFEGTRKYGWTAVKNGVVVSRLAARKLSDYLAERDLREIDRELRRRYGAINFHRESWVEWAIFADYVQDTWPHEHETAARIRAICEAALSGDYYGGI